VAALEQGVLHSGEAAAEQAHDEVVGHVGLRLVGASTAITSHLVLVTLEDCRAERAVLHEDIRAGAVEAITGRRVSAYLAAQEHSTSADERPRSSTWLTPVTGDLKLAQSRALGV
jgi:hypothetical protein